MDPYIILAKTEQGAWIETKEMGTRQWSKQEQLILVQGEDSKKGHLIYPTQKGSFQVILYKMIRFLSGKLKKHMKLAKIVKISIFVNRLVFPMNFNRFSHPMTLTHQHVSYFSVINEKEFFFFFWTFFLMFSSILFNFFSKMFTIIWNSSVKHQCFQVFMLTLKKVCCHKSVRSVHFFAM